MSAAVLDARPTLLAARLVALGLSTTAATELCSWIGCADSGTARLALLRDGLRDLGQQHQARALLDAYINAGTYRYAIVRDPSATDYRAQGVR